MVAAARIAEGFAGQGYGIFKPAVADVSVDMGWFHTDNIFSYARKGRSAEELAKIYFDSVGGNASMLLNVPPDKDGLINKREIKTLQKFILQCFLMPFRCFYNK